MKQARKVIPIKPEPGGNLPYAERDAVRVAVRTNRDKPGNLLPVLHAVQDALGYVPRDAIPLIAFELNLSRAEVHGVVSFYHWYRSEKPGRHIVYLCRAEACQSMGAARLEAHAKQSLGVDFHGTTADGALTLEPVYCLGNCALGPSVMIDDKLCGRVTPTRFDRLVGDMRA
ncbi:MAG: formate dehydrogenase subunit gamma [Panacagrimonas sp.]